MKKRTFLVTAGPTQEPIDPLRFISNRSTGTMGYELAAQAKDRGHKVILVSGPTALEKPKRVKFIGIRTAEEMLFAVKKNVKNVDCIIMSAAVADMTPVKASKNKIKKGQISEIQLVSTKDILRSIVKTKMKYKVGFSLETTKGMHNSKKKLKEKDLDLIIINKVTKKNDPFAGGNKDVTLLERTGKQKQIRQKSKKQIARAILDTVQRNML